MSKKNTVYFQAICEAGSLLAAAKKLNMTPPSLSKFLTQLEQELQVRLFERSKKGIVITEAGKAYLEYCNQLEHMYNTMRLNLYEVSNQSIFELKIGITPARGFYIIPELFTQFKKLRPAVKLELVERTASELEWLLVKREIHVALFTVREQLLQDNLLSYPICEEKILLIINKDILATIENKLGRKAGIKDFGKLPFILLPDTTRIGQLGYLQYKKANLSADIVYVQSLETAVQLVKAGFGVSFSSEIALLSKEKQEHLVGIPLDDNLSWKYIAATHTDYAEFSVIQDFIKTAQTGSWALGKLNDSKPR